MSKPDYRKQASGLAALGRGPDNALVHMSRDEVASLQKIANTAGGSLSINPKTGLPEAGFLNSILPMIAGGVASVLSGGTLVPILAGAATGALTGDKDQSPLMRAGLGALGGFGGSGIASSLAGLGTEAGKTAMTEAAKGTVTEAAGQATAEAGRAALQGDMARQALGQGIKSLGTEAGRGAFMSGLPFGKLSLAAAGAPVAAEAFKQPTLEPVETVDPMYYTGVTFDPYTGEYSGGEYTSEYPGMAEGGAVPPPDPMAQTRAYYQGLLTPQGSTPPSSQALIDYMNKLNTNVVQTPVPPRPTPPPTATSTVATPATATQPMSYGKKVKKKTVQVPLPEYSYDQTTGTYAQTSGPTGGATNPYASTDFDRILSVNSPYLLGIQDEIRRKLASQGAAGYAAGGSVMPQMPGGMPQQQPSTMPQMFGSMFQQQLPGGIASQSTPRQSDQMPGGMFRPMMPQMPGGMPQQQPSMMQSVMAPQQLGGSFSAPALRFAAGGPTYAAGGKLLRGPGDGMSDSIPAVIGGTQRAALADGEFVMPADVVAHLGNGSTTAGASRLYEMMDRVRKARTGSTTQPPAVNMGRLMPA